MKKQRKTTKKKITVSKSKTNTGAKKAKLKGKAKKQVKKKTIVKAQKKKSPVKKTSASTKTKSAAMQKPLQTPSFQKTRLPEQNGNKITLMTVDPWKLFAYWELQESALANIKGVLVLRVYDVTDIGFTVNNAHIVFDIAVYERAGTSYIGVGPGREFIVDIGAVVHGGGFISLARSNKIATPQLSESRLDEALFSAGYF